MMTIIVIIIITTVTTIVIAPRIGKAVEASGAGLHRKQNRTGARTKKRSTWESRLMWECPDEESDHEEHCD